MARRKAEIHLVPDPVESALLILTGAVSEPMAIPVIPTRRASSFWGRLARPSFDPTTHHDAG